MKQYLDLVQHVLTNGTRKENRTGVDTISTFNYNYEVDIQQGFPMLTTKEISWKNIVIELLWFLSGSDSPEFLERHGCKFWRPWYINENKVMNCYGPAWRQFPIHQYSDQTPHVGINDQIEWVLEELKRNPMSRRLVVSAWAPGITQTAPLPPCHAMFIFNVQNEETYLGYENNEDADFDLAVAKSLRWNNPENSKVWLDQTLTVKSSKQKLCLHLTQRSADVALGIPYNLASYSLLLSLFSRFTGIEPGTFAHTLIDAHIYCAKADGTMNEYDHISGLKQQLTREPKPLPKLIIDSSIKNLNDVTELLHPKLTTEELMKYFILEGYESWPKINFKVAV